MTEEKKPKVVKIFDKSEYIPREDEGLKPCQNTIMMLESMLEEAKNGTLRGLAGISWSEDQRWYKNYIAFSDSEDPTHSGMLMVAGMDMLKEALTGASFGHSDMAPEEDMEE